MTLRRLITGPIFLLLFLIVTPLRWMLMHAFGYMCKLSNWVTEGFRESLGMEEKYERTEETFSVLDWEKHRRD